MTSTSTPSTSDIARPGDSVDAALRALSADGSLPTATSRQIRTQVWQTLAGGTGRRRRLLAAAALLVTGAALELVVPASMGRMVDVVQAGAGAAAIWQLGGLMVAALLLGALVFVAGSVLTRAVVEEVLADLRERLVARSLAMSPEVIEQATTGDIIARATDDVAEVSEAVDTVLPVLAGAAVSIAVSLAGLGVLEWRLMLPLLLLVPFHVWSARSFADTAHSIYTAERAAMAQRADAVLSTLRGLPTVSAYGLAPQRSSLIGRGSWQVVLRSVQARVAGTRFFGRVNFGEFVGMSALLIVGFFLVRAGETTTGITVTAVLVFHRLFGPVGQLLMLTDTWQSASASLARMVGVLSVPVFPAADGASGRHIAADGTDLALAGVTFAYGDHTVVDDATITIPAGSTLALVGPSGAGKSTLAAIVSGTRRAESGSVRLGGVDLADLAPEVRARCVPLLTQHGHLFGGTVRDNLTLGRPAEDDDLWAALTLVGAHEWVRALPDGLDAMLGPDGATIPVVGAQQVALARIALLDPPATILDEASAESGSAGAALLDAAVDAVVARRTAIVVAHRLDQAARADAIAFMSDGRIVEHGTHTELLAAGGRYADAWTAWEQGRS